MLLTSPLLGFAALELLRGRQGSDDHVLAPRVSSGQPCVRSSVQSYSYDRGGVSLLIALL